MENLYNILEHLPKDHLNYLIYRLLENNKITYHDLTELHILHLKKLEALATDKYITLRSKIIGVYSGYKKDYEKNLKDIMHYLVDQKEVNMTHQYINNKK